MMYLRTFDDMQKSLPFFLLKPARSIYRFLTGLCGFVVAAVIFMYFFKVDETVPAQVVLRPATPVSSVRSMAGGQVVYIGYEDGQIVEQNALLFQVDTASVEKELSALHNQLDSTAAELREYEQLLLAMDTEASDITAKLASAYLFEKENYEISIKELAAKITREKNKPESMRIQKQIDELETQSSQLLYEYKTWLNKEAASALRQKESLAATVKQLESSIADRERQEQNAVGYAPISGKVLVVKKMNTGDYLLSGEEVIRIVPQKDESLKADLYVAGSVIPTVSFGNRVEMKFPGLPPSRFGQVSSTVSLIPADAVLDERNYPVFIVQADIQHPVLHDKHGFEANLIPGMSGEARIITNTCTIMELFLRKLDFIF